MHFAYPSHREAKPRPLLPITSRRAASVRRYRILKTAAALLLVIVLLIYFVQNGRGSRGGYDDARDQRVPSGKPPVVIITVLDDTKLSSRIISHVKENREHYAEKHGYQVFFPSPHDYDLKGAPTSWAKVVATRHALVKYPDASHVWYLDQDYIIVNDALALEDRVVKDAVLEGLMLRDQPVVPPDGIIHTFSHVRAPDVGMVLTQDREDLVTGSFVMRNGDFARYLLDTWFTGLYRTYNFQKAETHALEHIIQWHPTILAGVALVPQQTLNVYSSDDDGRGYTDGDYVVRLSQCAKQGLSPECEAESEHFRQLWAKP